MKNPKSKLDKAKERLMERFTNVYAYPDIYWSFNPRQFRRQLNNLIRLAREEGRKGR
jgi:hypothetical protein